MRLGHGGYSRYTCNVDPHYARMQTKPLVQTEGRPRGTFFGPRRRRDRPRLRGPSREHVKLEEEAPGKRRKGLRHRQRALRDRG